MALPIRILYCIEMMGHGGTERQLAALIRGFDRTRIEPALCTLKPSNMNMSDLDCPAIDLGFRTFRSPAALACAWRLRKFIVEQRVEVMHTFFQDPTLLAWIASQRTSIRGRVAGLRDMGFWRTPGKVAQLRLAYRRFDGFIANSRAVAAHASAADRIPLEKIVVIPNGLFLGDNVKQEGRRTPPIVGIVANMNREVKRLDLFLDAARLVRDRVADAQFVIIGDGHLRPLLELQVTSLGLEGCVRFLGELEDVKDDVRQFDVGVISSDSEGLSNAILEYMAAGVPTVARDVGGNAEAVEDGVTGRLVSGSRPQDLAAPIVSLLTDDLSRARMGQQARARAERLFSMDACVRRHEEYYERLLRELSPVG